jgi:hypothetical protein
MEPRQPATPPATTAAADSADELRRQALKARIRERVLREEAEQWELELEVRREIREQLLRLLWPVLGRSVAGSGTPGGAPPPARIVTGTTSMPIASREVRLYFLPYFLFCLVALSCLSSISVDLTFSSSHHIFSVEYCSHFCCILFCIAV